MNIKWGKVLDITLTIAGIAVPLITGRRQEAKAKVDMTRTVQEEVRRQLAKRRYG